MSRSPAELPLAVSALNITLLNQITKKLFYSLSTDQHEWFHSECMLSLNH